MYRATTKNIIKGVQLTDQNKFDKYEEQKNKIVLRNYLKPQDSSHGVHEEAFCPGSQWIPENHRSSTATTGQQYCWTPTTARAPRRFRTPPAQSFSGHSSSEDEGRGRKFNENTRSFLRKCVM